MRFLPRAAVALLVGASAPAALVAPVLAQTCACAPAGGGYVIQADEAPPPLPEYDQPPIPAPGYLWTPGYWAWNNVDYFWVPGVWVEPPEPGLLWTPGYWGFVGGLYAFRQGYWGREVGFYGGVNYGFGYTGNGYQGGHWQGQNFFYNTAVNNIRTTQVTNVYNASVVVNNVTTINRVSYNGGAGGVVATPTPQQLSIASQPHIPANSAPTEPGPRRQRSAPAVYEHEPRQACRRCDASSRRFQRQGGGAGQSGRRRASRPAARTERSAAGACGTTERPTEAAAGREAARRRSCACSAAVACADRHAAKARARAEAVAPAACARSSRCAAEA